MSQSMKKTIDVEFCEEQIEVTVELFNHDDTPTFSIESVFFEDVDILHFIDSLGGLSKLTDVVEKKLKEDANDD